MRGFFTLNRQIVLKIVLIIVVACAIGLLAGHNDKGALMPADQQFVVAPHAKQSHHP
jgi:hypothetical protein